MREGALIGPIIVAIGLVVAAISFALVGAILETAEGTTELRLERVVAENAALRDEILQLTDRIDAAEANTRRILDDVARLASSSAPRPAPPVAVPGDVGHPGDHPETEDLTEVMRLAKSRFNIGITQPGNREMLELLGRPRGNLSQECAGVDNTRLKELLETRQIGPIRVTMIRPALDSLERIMKRLEETEIDIHDAVGTEGALCVRFIRGSTRSISNHSWGTAIDIKLNNRLDGFADNGTQFGLLLLAELFNEEGWYWGATYDREDSMHFEVGVETLRAWAAAGQI